MQKLNFLTALFFVCFTAQAAPQIGAPAPDFSLATYDGKKISLKDLKDKIVVLEWFNKDCPFVRKHYDSKNMQSLQKEFGQKGVQWLVVISSKKGKQGYLTPSEAKAVYQQEGMAAASILFDPEGTVGKAYEAKTTPHLYVIDKKGKLLYMGAIDDQPSTDLEDIAKAKNYVRQALEEAMAGKPVTTTDTDAYGCGIKY